MFLTNPTLEELLALDISTLLDMLSYQTVLLLKLAKSDGVSGIVQTSNDLLIDIQAAIKIKKKVEKNSTGPAHNISLIKNTTPKDPAS
jgi:hypothetical protein